VEEAIAIRCTDNNSPFPTTTHTVTDSSPSPNSNENFNKLLSLNVQTTMAKIASFDNLLQEHDPDIIAISETWLKSEILLSEFLPPDFNVFRRDRLDGYGGVLIACHISLNCHHLDLNCDVEAIACQIILASHQTLIMCAFYRPPSRQLESATNLHDFFRSIVDHYSDSPVWIAGDLNLPNINWDTRPISSSVYPSNLCDTVIDFVEEYGFTQAVNFGKQHPRHISYKQTVFSQILPHCP